MSEGASSISVLLSYEYCDYSCIGHHGKTLMLLKKSSKRARSRFKRKKLNVAGFYQEIKAKGGLMIAANPMPSAIAQGSAGKKPQLIPKNP